MIVQTMGLEASASTWLFNISREVSKLKYDRCYAVSTSNLVGLQKEFVLDGKLIHELPSPRMEQPDCIVIKSHAVEGELYWLLRAAGARFILSVRDPRDSIASMIERMGEREQAWAPNLARSLSSVMTASRGANCLIYSYEDRFFDDPNVMEGLAAFLEVRATRDELLRCFEHFSRDNVRKIVSGISDLGSGRLLTDHAGRTGDHDTQFNAKHIGDGRSGKWRDVIHRSLWPIIDSSFSNIAGKTNLDSGYTMRFHEALFSPVVMQYETPYDTSRYGDGTNVLLMRDCWLPRGRWRFRLTGGFPYGTKVHIRCGHNSKSIFESDIDNDSLESFDFEFEASIAHFDKAINVFAFGDSFSMLDPLRHNAVVLEAAFMHNLL